MLHDKGKGEKLKVKVKSSTEQAMKTHRKSSTLSLTLAIDEGAWLRQHSSPANREGPHYAGWVRPETGKDGRGKSRHRDSIPGPDRPAHNETLHKLGYPGPRYLVTTTNM